MAVAQKRIGAAEIGDRECNTKRQSLAEHENPDIRFNSSNDRPALCLLLGGASIRTGLNSVIGNDRTAYYEQFGDPRRISTRGYQPRWLDQVRHDSVHFFC